MRTFFAHTYRERRLLARGMKPGPEKDSKNLQAFAALDQTKVQLVFDKGRVSLQPVLAFDRAEGRVLLLRTTGARRGDRSVAATRSSRRAASWRGPTGAAAIQSVVDARGGGFDPATAVSQSPIFFRGPADANEPSRYCEIYNRFSGIVPRPSGDSRRLPEAAS